MIMAVCMYSYVTNVKLLLYRDPSLVASELTTKLEPAFLSGLRCSQPEIRSKFFEVSITVYLPIMVMYRL